MKDKEPAPRDTFTKVPNAIYDILPYMNEAELKVTLAIIRQTNGWHRERQTLSLTALMELSQLTKQGVLNGLAAGIERGTIQRTETGTRANGTPVYSYEITVNEIDRTEYKTVNEIDRETVETVNEIDSQSRETVNEVDYIKRKTEKERTEKEKRVTPQQQLFQAICDALGYDYQLLERSQRGRVAQLSGKLSNADPPYSAVDVTEFAAWWTAHDWRGKKGSYPTPAQLLTEIAKWRNSKRAPQLVKKIDGRDYRWIQGLGYQEIVGAA